MTEPSSKSEVCQKCERPFIYDGAPEDVQYCMCFLSEPQPPVSAPEKCACPEAPCNECCIHSGPKTDSAQPTPSEGPYHPAMDRLSVKFGPDEFQVKFSSPETVGTECILMNMGFAQGQASSAKEIEELKKFRTELKTLFDDYNHYTAEYRIELLESLFNHQNNVMGG